MDFHTDCDHLHVTRFQFLGQRVVLSIHRIRLVGIGDLLRQLSHVRVVELLRVGLTVDGVGGAIFADGVLFMVHVDCD